MGRPKVEKEECKHEDTYPVAFFDEQDFSDCAYLVVECENCNKRFALFGEQVST
jgi:hypothetical protein